MKAHSHQHLHLVRAAPDPRLPTCQQTNADRHWLAMRGAWRDGQAVGERQGYTTGWRWGVVCGACGVVALALAAAAVGGLLGLQPWR